MKIVFFFIIAILCMAGTGCSKNGPAAPAEKENVIPAPVLRVNGEDDDPPIIIERTKKRDNTPVGNSMVVFYNASDTVQGFTNSNGELTLPLPAYGTWNIKVTHDDFQTVDGVVVISQLHTQRTDSLDNK